MDRAYIAKRVIGIAPQLQNADLQDVVSGALVKIQQAQTDQVSVLNAIRWSLAEWLRDQTNVPQPTEDTGLSEAQYLDTGKRRGRHGEFLQRTKRELQTTTDSTWQAITAKLSERETQVATRLAAGWSDYDIAEDLGIERGTAQACRRRLAKRLTDRALWIPILDALYSLPATKIERAEFDTDLSEYRRPRFHASEFVSRKDKTAQRQLIFTTWFVPCHEKRQAPLSWYPGMPIKRWEPTSATGLLQHAFDLAYEPSNNLKFAPKHAGKRSMHADNQDMADCHLARREANGLANGRRWFFESRTHGTMLSCPVIRREFDAAGMFQPHVQ